MANEEWMICEGAGKCGEGCLPGYNKKHIRDNECSISCRGYRCIPCIEPVTGLEVEVYHINPKTVRVGGK